MPARAYLVAQVFTARIHERIVAADGIRQCGLVAKHNLRTFCQQLGLNLPSLELVFRIAVEFARETEELGAREKKSALAPANSLRRPFPKIHVMPLVILAPVEVAEQADYPAAVCLAVAFMADAGMFDTLQRIQNAKGKVYRIMRIVLRQRIRAWTPYCA